MSDVLPPLPENCWYLEEGVGIDYMGIWEMKLHDQDMGSPRHNKPHEHRVYASKTNLLWFVNEETKPHIRPTERDKYYYSRKRLAYSYDELNSQFIAAIDKHMKQYQYYLTLTAANIQFTLSELGKLNESNLYTKDQIAKTWSLKCPIF